MKQFYRLNLTEQPHALSELYRNVETWRKELTSIFLSSDDLSAQVLAEIIDSLLACQDEDGLCRLLIDESTPPSDARVDFWYWPTYFLTASLIREQLIADQTGGELPSAWSQGLNSGLSAATTRRFAGHGFEDEDVRIEVLNFYLDAGLWPFLAVHGSEHPEFTQLVTEILSQQRQALLSGHTHLGYSDYAQPWQDLQARTGGISHLFVYGTLMTGQIAQYKLSSHEGCKLEGQAFLTGYRLYDLGAYPAIVSSESGDCPVGDDLVLGSESSVQNRGPALVNGELYRIEDEQLDELDRYEGEGDLYNRIASVVQMVDGQREIAWIYEYNYPVNPSQEVPLGLQPWNSEPSSLLANRYVWYVSYGSNLLRERFLCYIRGGWFRKIRSYEGCRDQSLPICDLPCQVPYDMYYGNQSPTWQNGGVAFLDHNKRGKSQGRAYLITREQFEDIHRQEGRSVNWYDLRLDLGLLGGIPVATFTNHTRLTENPPSKKYLNVVREGIRECKGI